MHKELVGSMILPGALANVAISRRDLSERSLTHSDVARDKVHSVALALKRFLHSFRSKHSREVDAVEGATRMVEFTYDQSVDVL